MDIQVETQSGVVSLTGFVRSLDDIVKAGELARAVSGVSAVRNSLRVADRPSRA
jgi:osmotically-inducible protein OsmY